MKSCCNSSITLEAKTLQIIGEAQISNQISQKIYKGIGLKKIYIIKVSDLKKYKRSITQYLKRKLG